MKVADMKVDLVDHMGSDLSVVNAARVSFDKESEWEYGEQADYQLGNKDAKLIRYLAHHNHWSPFAHTSIQLRVKAPIFVARQLVKHQVGGVWNEVSRRYVDSEPEFWFPDEWRGRPAGSMKQGSSGVVKTFTSYPINGNPYQAAPEEAAEVLCEHAVNLYHEMIDGGIAPEQARMILPQNTMTEWYWTGSLMFFCRVCRERLAPGAQYETRLISEQIAEKVAPLFPASWSALMKN